VVTGNLTVDGRPNRFSNGKLISMPTLGEAYATGVEGEGAAALRPYGAGGRGREAKDAFKLYKGKLANETAVAPIGRCKDTFCQE
jgi:hypothetical protein